MVSFNQISYATTCLPHLGVLHLLLHLTQLILQFLLVAEQVVDLLLHLVLQLLDHLVDFTLVALLVLEDLQLCVELFVLVLQVFHLKQAQTTEKT